MQIIDTIMDWERFEDEIASHTASLIKAQVRLPVSLPLPPPPGSTEESKLDNSEMISRKRLDNSVAEFGASVSSRVMERDMNEMMNMIREQNQRIKVLERTLETYGNAIESSTSLSMATIESMDKKIVRIGDSMSKVNQNHANFSDQWDSVQKRIKSGEGRTEAVAEASDSLLKLVQRSLAQLEI